MGLWESTYRGRGGEANSLLLKADSTLDRYYVRAFDFHYSTFGDSLLLQPIIADSFLPPGATVAPVFTSSYVVQGDTLVHADSLRTEWLVRVGPPPDDPASIVGTWKSVRSTTATNLSGYQRFRPDSVLEVRLPVSVKHGTYRLGTDSLTMFVDTDTSRCGLTWLGDTLTLSRTFTNGKFSFGYLRGGKDVWYPLPDTGLAAP